MTSWKAPLILIFGLLLSCAGQESIQQAAASPPTTVQCVVEVGETAPINASYSRRLRRVADQSREAAVQVHSIDRSVRGSGTYFTMGEHHIVITAAHVVRDMPVSLVATEEGETQLAVVSYLMSEGEEDLAVLLLSAPLEGRTAMELKISRDYDGLVGNSLVYTGYPAHHERMTVFGNVANIETGHIIMHSYTWPGASGSAVFDERGNLIGIVRAVDVNRGPFGPQITEDIVWLFPARSLDLDKISKFLDVYEILLEESQE